MTTETSTVLWAIEYVPAKKGIYYAKSRCVSDIKGWVHRSDYGWEEYWENAPSPPDVTVLLTYNNDQ